MKKITLILFAFLVLASCKDEDVQKPEKLLSEDEMVDVLYDITMLQSIRSVDPQELRVRKVEIGEYIYNKYKIDSTVFAQNHEYYASQLDVYERIHNKVNDRIKKVKEEYEGEVPKTEKDSVNDENKKMLGVNALKKLKEQKQKH